MLRKNVLDFVLNKRLPPLRLGPRVQPIADIEQRRRGEDRDESFHAFTVLAAESQHGLGGEPGEDAGDQGEDPAEMDVANRRLVAPITLSMAMIAARISAASSPSRKMISAEFKNA